MDFAKWNRLFTKTLTKNHEASFRDLSEFDTKLFEQKPWADFRETKTWKTATTKNAKLYWTELLLKTKTLICKTQNANFTDKKILKTERKIYCKFLPTVCVTRAGAGDGEAVQLEKC